MGGEGLLSSSGRLNLSNKAHLVLEIFVLKFLQNKSVPVFLDFYGNMERLISHFWSTGKTHKTLPALFLEVL